MEIKHYLYLLFSLWCLSVESQTYKETGLPVCYIETEENKEIVSKTEYLNASLVIVNGSDTLLPKIDLQIRGRGNATWLSYPKKPYRLKFGKNIDFLSCHGKHFALLPNYCDKSLMRVAIGFQTSRLLEMEWTPADEYIELVLNGEHLGNYQFVETVRQGKKRVNVTDDGFLLQYDRYWYQEEPVWFFTEEYNYPMIVKHPDDDEITDQQLETINQTMNSFENLLTQNSAVWESADMESFVKWYYAANLLALLDANYYFYKYDADSESKIKIGPLWDFEWSLGIGWYDGERPNPNHEIVNDCYFQQLNNDNEFMLRVAQFHAENGNSIKSQILDYYDCLTEKLEKSQVLNFKKWDILNEKVSVGGYPLGSWQAEVDCDKAFFIQHYTFLDNTFNIILNTIAMPSATRQNPYTAIYTLSGQRVGKDGLRKGIYIVNGRKCIIR